jgi:histidinol-phosphatase (PHP family)
MIDYHMHVENYYPFGRTPDTRPSGSDPLDTIRSFAESARAANVDEFAITEHIYHFTAAREIVEQPWSVDKCFYDMDTYVDLLQRAQKEGLPVKVGIEMDFVEGKEAIIERVVKGYPFDFVLGSVHWIGDWGFDLSEHKHEWDTRRVDDAYRDYFRLLSQAVKTGFFDSMSHPDLIKVMGHLPEMDMAGLYEELADSVASQPGLCVEISSAGLRKPVGRLYPEQPLMKAFARRGIPITTASDAHFAEDIGKDFDQVAALARDCGYATVMSFTERTAKAIPL